MKYNDIKDLSLAELKKKKTQLTESLFTSKMKNTIGQLANPLEIRFVRKDLARINTAITQKTLAK